MPNYDYRCPNCREIKIVTKSIKDESLEFCPICGSGYRMDRLITCCNPIFKGRGWTGAGQGG